MSIRIHRQRGYLYQNHPNLEHSHAIRLVALICSARLNGFQTLCRENCSRLSR